ncbi:MAG: substrate-binding domain-containing protein [Planctomycetes bacterium]|nr:substrate-binding domain-containing protein [Planctomycetota bacterium]MCB9883975.1 substrate-binding domain-containing protein [Planctomycetota bacterium]
MALTMSCLIAVLAAVPQRTEPENPPHPAPRAADTASPGAVLDALYATISGPMGEKRDWQRLRSLFAPEGRMVAMVKDRAGGMRPVVLKVDDYVQRAGGALERDGFFELEIGRQTQRFGDMAHVFSSYECKHARDDAAPFLRGINSVQLVKQGGRWSILQILWEQEADAGPIPPQYLVAATEANDAAAPVSPLTVRLVGSDLLLDLMQQWGKDCPPETGVRVEVAGGGTGTGFHAFATRKAEVTMASRRIADEELKKARESGAEPLEVCIGYVAAAVCVHRDNPLESLDLDRLRAIASADPGAARWSQLGVEIAGGGQHEIALRMSAPGALWSFAFQRAVFSGGAPQRSGGLRAEALLDFVRSQPDALVVASSHGAEGVKVVPIAAKAGGAAVLPTAQTCKDGSYPLAVPLYVYYRDEPTGRIKEFVRWLSRDAGRALLERQGIVPARD